MVPSNWTRGVDALHDLDVGAACGLLTGADALVVVGDVCEEELVCGGGAVDWDVGAFQGRAFGEDGQVWRGRSGRSRLFGRIRYGFHAAVYRLLLCCWFTK